MSDAMRNVEAKVFLSAFNACLIPPEDVSVGVGDKVYVYIHNKEMSKRIRAACAAVDLPCKIVYMGGVKPAQASTTTGGGSST